jgi:rubrerythrin
MEKFVTLEDVIKFAVEREDTAVKLYTRAAELATSVSSRKMFEELAQEEATHKDVFVKIDEDKSENHKLCTLPESSLAKYLAEVPFRPDMSYSQIIANALKAEENAYQLYKTAAGMTDDPRLQKVLMTFADVELGHRRRLEAVYDERVLTEG